MRLLFVTFSVPHPPLTGNGLIGLHHIRYLAARHTVDLLSFKRRDSANEVADLQAWCQEIELVDQLPRLRVLARVALGLLGNAPLSVFRYKSARMSGAVNGRLEKAAYDVVIYQGLQMAQYLPPWYRGASVSALEDPPSLTSEQMLTICPWYARPLVWHRLRRQRQYERRLAASFDRVILVNQKDCVTYKRVHEQATLDWVPVGVDTNAFAPSDNIARHDGMIVISGNMRSRPNVEGVLYFCRDIFPLICEQEPKARLWVVGAKPVKAIRALARDYRIKITGFVPDVRHYLQQATVSVCPIRLKIGTQTKVLEALACGTPVVTFSAGNYGIDGVSGQHLYVADDPTDFADRVVSLLRHERWSDFSRNGRQLVEGNFTWDKSAGKFEQILKQLAGVRKLDFVPA